MFSDLVILLLFAAGIGLVCWIINEDGDGQ
jgi:hypothetical protein